MKFSRFDYFYIAFILFNIVSTIVISSIYNQNEIKSQNEIELQNGFTLSAIEATAGIVTIVFAISILVIQHAASNYSPSILNDFKTDKKFWFSLCYGIFTIMFLSISLILNYQIILLNLFYFITTLGLLAIFFLYTFGKINPVSIVKNIENEIIQECINISKKIEKILKKNKREDTIDDYKNIVKNMPKTAAYSILTNNPTLIEKLKNNEFALRQIILDSIKKRDHDTSRVSLDAYPSIFENYLKIIPNYLWLNDQFLEKLLADLKSYVADGIQNNNHIFLEYLFDTLKKSGYIFAKNINSSDAIIFMNQPLSTCVSYLNEFGKNFLINNEYDLTVKTMKSMGDLGQISFKHYYHDHSVIEKILNIANIGIQKKDFYIPTTAMHESFKIIRESIKNMSNKSLIKNYIIKDNINNLSDMLEKFMDSRINTMTISSGFMGISDTGIISCVREVLIKNRKDEQFQIYQLEEFQKMIINSLIELVCKVGQNAKQYKDIGFINICVDCVTIIAMLITPQKFITIDKGYEDELEKIILWLQTLQYDENIIPPNRITEILFYCYKNDYNKLGDYGIKIISKIAHNILENETETGYKSLYVLKTLNLIACYGVSSNNLEISIKVADEYLNFEEKYVEKFGGNTKHLSIYDANLSEYPDLYNIQFGFQEIISQIITPKNRKKFEEILNLESENRKKSSK